MVTETNNQNGANKMKMTSRERITEPQPMCTATHNAMVARFTGGGWTITTIKINLKLSGYSPNGPTTKLIVKLVRAAKKAQK